MTITLPRLIQTPSPNTSGRMGARPRLIVVHDTEGTYGGAIAWFAQVRSQVSAHLVMREDGAEVTQMVPLSEKAWHACAYNSVSIGVEGAGFAKNGYSENWWNGMATIVAWLLHRYGLPCRWAHAGTGEGVCSHHDLGIAGGGHNDPCAIGSADWTRFLSLIETAHRNFGLSGLPDWALHGLPAVTAVSLPPPLIDGASSHDGRPGADAKDMFPRNPDDQFPVGSLPDIQRRLNLAGANPTLVVDGYCGPATFAAIETFQRGSGLRPDGIVGTATLSALDRATA